MDGKTNPSPGFRDHPEHKVMVEPFDGVVTVSVRDAVIASSDKALKLQEASYPAVYYLPFRDIYFDLMQKSATASHCPFKGEASYWSATVAGDAIEDVMWAYQDPYDEMTGIKDYGAFYPNKVSIEVVPRSGDR